MNKKIAFALLLLVVNVFTQYCEDKSSSHWNNQFGDDSCTDHSTYEQRPDAYPLNSLCHREVNPQVLDIINELYPEGEHISDALVSDYAGFRINQDDAYAYFTYLKTGAGYRNRIALYTPGGDGPFGMEYLMVFPYVDSFSSQCLRRGDTVKVGPLPAGRYGIVLYADYHNVENPKGTYYSDISFDEGMESPDFMPHMTWVYINEADDTVFGFEDMNGGDNDYNDVMFTIHIDGDADFVDRPIYNDGRIEKCVPLETITSASYAEHECYSWGLLETTGAQSCRFYLKPPPGYIIAPLDDLSKGALETVGKWADNFDCVGLEDENGNIVGRRPSNPDEECTVIEHETLGDCHAIDCSQRILLRRRNPFQSCGLGYEFCDGEPRTVNTYPSLDLGWTVFPSELHSFLPREVGASYVEDVTVRNYFHLSKLSVDLAIVVDRYEVEDSDVRSLKAGLGDLFDRAESSLDLRVSISGIDNNGISFTPFRREVEDSDFHVFDTKLNDKSNVPASMVVNGVKGIHGWRESEALKIVYFVSPRSHGDITNEQVREILDSNVMMMFGGPNRQSQSVFGNAIPLAIHHRLNHGQNRFKNYLDKFVNEDVNHFATNSYAHLVSDDSYVTIVDQSTTFSVGAEGTHAIEVTFNGPVDTQGARVGLVSFLGRQQTYIHLRHPTGIMGVYDLPINMEEGVYTHSFDIPGTVQSGRLRYKLTPESLSLDHTLEFSSGNPVPMDDYFESRRITVRVNEESVFGMATYKYVVEDGCDIEEGTITIYYGCEDPSQCFTVNCYPDRLSLSGTKGESVRFMVDGISSTEELPLRRKIVSLYGNDASNRFVAKVGDDYVPLTEGFTTDQPIEGYFQSDQEFGTEINSLVYEVSLFDGGPSARCSISFDVTPSYDPPQYGGQKDFTGFEDLPLFISINPNDIEYEESSNIPNRLGVIVDDSPIQYGTLMCCYGEDCSVENCDAPQDEVPSFVFNARPNDYGQENNNYHYATFNVTFFDRHQPEEERTPSNYRFNIRILPVNDAPVIEVEEGINVLGETNEPNVITRGEEFVFSWTVHDIDNMPNTLQTSVLAYPYTRVSTGDAYRCVGTEEECSEEVTINPPSYIVPTTVSYVNCGSPEELKNRLGEGLEGCHAKFTLRYVPHQYRSPYVLFTLQGTDFEEINSLSTLKQIVLSVTPVNIPPEVWSPPRIETTSSRVDLRVGNQTIRTADEAPPTWIVALTFTSTDLNGKFIIPEHVESKCEINEDKSVSCNDTIGSINEWAKELKFELDEGETEANITFVVNDNGYPQDLTPLLSEEAVTQIVVVDSIIPPPPNNKNLLIIALSVGAAGAAIIGVLVALLRNKLSPPSDDYFNLGTEKLAVSPESPLYESNTKEVYSTYYRGG